MLMRHTYSIPLALLLAFAPAAAYAQSHPSHKDERPQHLMFEGDADSVGRTLKENAPAHYNIPGLPRFAIFGKEGKFYLGIGGAVVVTTPQLVALADARKGIAMFRDPKINVPVLGLVDNMAWFTPEKHPDERYYLFGDDANVDALAAEYSVPVLARIPLVAAVGEHSDAGKPVALENTMSAQAFVHLAREVVDAVERRNDSLPPTEKVHVK